MIGVFEELKTMGYSYNYLSFNSSKTLIMHVLLLQRTDWLGYANLGVIIIIGVDML